MDSKSVQFFKHARRSGLWPEAEAVHRNAATKSHNNLGWQTLQSSQDDKLVIFTSASYQNR